MDGKDGKRGGVLGGALVPHAPQFFSLPDTEDKATVERVRVAMGAAGARLAALKPDLWIVIANDHANQFLLHCTPPFCFHLGAEVGGSFVGRDFRFRVASDAATKLMLHMQSEGFDPAFTNNAEIDYAFGIPLTFLGVDAPIVPLYVNSYVPPQPPMLRCFAFGAALARGVAAVGISAVVIASGGMSHFPGTNRYSRPEVDFDRRLFEILKGGNLRQLLALDERLLDDMGNVELRSWAIAAGLLGERKPDVGAFEPSWHHTYAMLAWHDPPVARTDPLHYPPVHPERVRLTSLLYRLANDEHERHRFLGDPPAFAASAELAPDEAAALAAMDQGRLLALGIHPLVIFLAQMQIEHERRQP
jgi:2,3-dihydroxyphenylpropionate 1,2-dioxygenase